MKSPLWRPVRKQLAQLALRYPPLVATLMFLFFYTVSNHVYFTTAFAIQVPAFWHMLMMGALMASFGAVLLYEVLRLYKKLTELQLVRVVVGTLQHEINNPLAIIRLSAEKLQSVKTYQGDSVQEILTQVQRIQEVVVRLSDLEREVQLHPGPGALLIDPARSR